MNTNETLVFKGFVYAAEKGSDIIGLDLGWSDQDHPKNFEESGKIELRPGSRIPFRIHVPKSIWDHRTWKKGRRVAIAIIPLDDPTIKTRKTNKELAVISDNTSFFKKLANAKIDPQ